MSSPVEYVLEDFKPHSTKELKEGEGLDVWEEDELVANNVYLDENVRNLIASKPNLTDEEKLIIQRLAMKAFHFPNHSYWEDWYMFLSNNHILLSFFLAHPLHPFGRKERILNLVASLSFGLAATSSIALWYFHHQGDESITYISIFGLFKVTQGLIVSAFFGGFCNVLFDFFIWYLQVCPLCQPGSPLADKLSDRAKNFWLWMGSNLAFIVTAIAICLAIHFIALRASVIDDGNEDGYAENIHCYSFISSFLLEVLVTQAIMFPIVAFTIFSGVLGCFTLPGIGGRPYQKKRTLMRIRRQRQKESVPMEV
jgi:hypothetical protein